MKGIATTIGRELVEMHPRMMVDVLGGAYKENTVMVKRGLKEQLRCSNKRQVQK